MIGTRRAAPRARSGWRRSPAATTARASASRSTSDALRSLPALDHALSTGALTLDQVAAAAEFATPASDAELARVAVGKAPSAIALAARTLVPPTVDGRPGAVRATLAEHDLDARRRELAFSGRLPLEQGAAFEQAIWNIAKTQRAPDKQAGTRARVAAVRRRRTRHPRPPAAAQDGGARRSPTTLIVHLSDDAPPLLEGAGPISPETAERLTCDARRLTIKPQRTRPPALTRRTLRLLRPATRTAQTLTRTANTPAAPPARELEAHHLTPVEHGGKTELDNLILLCPRHHKLLHDHHIHTSGTGDQPAFTDADRTRDHHQPATRTTRSRGVRRSGPTDAPATSGCQPPGRLPELEPGAFRIDRPSEAPVLRLLQRSITSTPAERNWASIASRSATRKFTMNACSGRPKYSVSWSKSAQIVEPPGVHSNCLVPQSEMSMPRCSAYQARRLAAFPAR